MRDRDHITVVNAYGDIIEGATAKDIKVGGGYSRNTLVDIRAPGYMRRRVSPTRGGVVMLAMSPEMAKGPRLEDACRTNLAVAANVSAIGDSDLGDWFDLDEPIEAREDRCYFRALDGSLTAKMLDRTGAFRRVPAGLHDPHDEGFEEAGSWKTTRGAPDLQVTLWRLQAPGRSASRKVRVSPIVDSRGSPGATFVAELDLDLRTGRGHVFEVARNHLTGGKTHPYLANQALSWTWGVVSFRLEAGK